MICAMAASLLCDAPRRLDARRQPFPARTCRLQWPIIAQARNDSWAAARPPILSVSAIHGLNGTTAGCRCFNLPTPMQPCTRRAWGLLLRRLLYAMRLMIMCLYLGTILTLLITERPQSDSYPDSPPTTPIWSPRPPPHSRQGRAGRYVLCTYIPTTYILHSDSCHPIHRLAQKGRRVEPNQHSAPSPPPPNVNTGKRPARPLSPLPSSCHVFTSLPSSKPREVSGLPKHRKAMFCKGPRPAFRRPCQSARPLGMTPPCLVQPLPCPASHSILHSIGIVVPQPRHHRHA
ncbi:hypothetical protein P280DRAFT_101032 [Massarina eburnea CBS 473.64]|uniref:Uncharacterized protein n=1 Tax=Massarina eburnea CBS 473.64 TaxID=1395130 RepID=A0A6A6RQ85_9PLEO|nr:hypothetical protein P280DRAFT_101032 [Massarina eburnea CBS 473.64]